eukprot:CAMPEP_0197414462 /NCGR_PEP_ID=MMETSP1170-20131217/1169_1 /TAXON_ID=54406 /ORGANISM="Sarcinochrysis sp, Strain CCMP770" /LENGTH=83 /DNA_ID=CAMNT_0042941179 /DNA_START=31 /DNA_END=282 /DNA_ORIENTATION=+
MGDGDLPEATASEPMPVVDDFDEEGDPQQTSMFCFWSCTGIFDVREPTPPEDAATRVEALPPVTEPALDEEPAKKKNKRFFFF